ncbi:unnamed protein product [Echinostoma caproni]|uniref:CUB domain-containing protein n=1 Tax=Echinostoma caproni TaxID=27848 RepID=A0A183AJ85_9TREM|nr:unnamed protein product [Echinostoma caproni]
MSASMFGHPHVNPTNDFIFYAEEVSTVADGHASKIPRDLRSPEMRQLGIQSEGACKEQRFSKLTSDSLGPTEFNPKCGQTAVDLTKLAGAWTVPEKALSGAGTCDYTLTGAIPDQTAHDPNCGQTAVDLTKLAGAWTVPEKALSGAGTCDYTLTGASEKKYKLEFTAFTVGTSDQCTNDYVQGSFDGQYTAQKYKKCGTNVSEQPPVSLSNVINVKMVSSATNAGTNTFTATVKEGD